MAKFTFTLQELISLESYDEIKNWFKQYNLSDYLTPEEIQVIRERNTWNEDKLAEHCVNTYILREIGLETPALFKLKLKDALEDIMEEKAPLIYSACIKIDPVNEFEIKENGLTKNRSQRDDNGSGLVVNSNTPQGQISKSSILQGEYASSTSANENENHVESSDNGEQERISTGHNQSQSRLIREYRSNIIMINREIVRDLASLFIGIY